MNDIRKSRIHGIRAFLALMLWGMLSAGSAWGFTEPPNFVGTRFEGCRNDGSINLPIAGKFICPDSAYTPGNLDKGWDELDLVPFRLTTSSGNQAGPSTTYNVYIAADYRRNTLGYDFISIPVVNTAKSDASCAVSASNPQTVATGITGGTDETVYRELTITQNQGSTCVFDWYQRLAIGAAAFSGSNLQAYIFEKVGLSAGKSTIPIPVNEISPQKMSKTMQATRDASHTWNVTKSAAPGSLDFGNVCKAPSGPLEKDLKVTVTWTKLEATANGDVKVLTNINVENPAARTITVNVTDKVYAGQTAVGALLATQSTGDIDVPANYNGLLTTLSYTIPAVDAGGIGSWLNDVAVATYKDKVTNEPISGTVTATAKAQIALGTTLNETVNIADLETISGTGLSFKVGVPSTGSFTGYTAGSLATSVNWGVMGLTDTGSITFDKTVVLDQRRITSGELTDIATLVSTDSQFTTQAALFPVSIASSARVALTVRKTIPLALKAGESMVVSFTVTPTAGGTPIPVNVTFTGPSVAGAAAQTTIENLAPASYTVTEGASTFYDAANPAGKPVNLLPTVGQQTVDLSPKAGGVMDESNCAGTVDFVNNIPGSEYPLAKVAKITLPALTSADPDYLWTFTLSGPPNFVGTSVQAAAGQAFVEFLTTPLTEEGTYTITETLKSKWDLTGIIQPDGSSSTTVCTFTVDFPNDFGKRFECTFTNTKRGTVTVIKTLKGQALTTQQFTFQLRQGASSNADGTALETLTTNAGGNGSTLNFATALIPGATYQMCEATQAGWMTSFNDPTSSMYVPGAFLPPGTTVPNVGVDNSWLCVNFTVQPGATKVFNIDNSPPPGGRALTIGYWKTHASCSLGNGNQAPALDKTLFGTPPNGILKGSKIVSLANLSVGVFGLYGKTATSTPDCPHAVSLLDKRNFSGVKKSSDPLFNMVAQLVAVELNLTAGSYTCPAMANAVTAAEGLLTKYKFNGTTYTPSLSKADSTLANSLATKLDDYNNNRPGVCP